MNKWVQSNLEGGNHSGDSAACLLLSLVLAWSLRVSSFRESFFQLSMNRLDVPSSTDRDFVSFFILHLLSLFGARIVSVIAQDALAEYRTWPLDTSVQALSHRSVAASLMGSPGGTDLSGVSRAINARLCSHSAEHSSPWPSQPFAGLIINEVLRALLWFQVAPGQIDDSAQKRYVPVVCLFSCRPDLRI